MCVCVHIKEKCTCDPPVIPVLPGGSSTQCDSKWHVCCLFYCINNEDTRLATVSPHRVWKGNVFKVSYALVASLCTFTTCILQLLKAMCAYSAQRENVWSFHYKAIPKYRSWNVMSAHCSVCSDLKLQLCLYYRQISCLCVTQKRVAHHGEEAGKQLLARLHLLPMCMETTKTLQRSKLQQHLLYAEQFKSQ